MKLVHMILYVLLTMTLIIAIFTVGPALETKFWPPYSHFKLVRSEDTKEGLKIIAQFVKNRNCAPQGYGWYLGEFGILKQVITRSTDIIQHRPLGNQLGTFVIKELTTADIPYLYAEVYHHCHPLWLSRSVIYP